MEVWQQEVIVEALRVLFLLALPVVLVMALVGTLVGALQGATMVQDSALGYAARVLALIFLLYALLPTAVGSLVRLAEMAWT